MKGADVFLGLSAKDVVNKDMVKSMAKNPIIFACANPDPEIKPELIEEVRDDAIIATGRSDYPNQVNNLIGFPYICLLYTSPSPRDKRQSRMPSSA